MKDLYPSRDYWNDHAQYEQIFGENFVGSFPSISKTDKQDKSGHTNHNNPSRILATNIYTDDTNNLTSIRLQCHCENTRKKDPWNY